MDSIRKRILENVISTLEGIQNVRKVFFGGFDPSEHNLPCVGLLKPEETYAIASHDRLEEVTLRFELHVAVNKTSESAGWELENICWEVEKALAEDPSRGGLAGFTRETSRHRLYADDIVDDACEQMFFEIEYMREQKDPRF